MPDAGTARPPQVLAAAILGFVVALFALLAAVSSFGLAGRSALFLLFAAFYLGLAAASVWGGMLALQGRRSTVLKTVGLTTAGLALLGLMLALPQGTVSIWPLLLVAAGAGIFLLLTQPASQQWFTAHGAR